MVPCLVVSVLFFFVFKCPLSFLFCFFNCRISPPTASTHQMSPKLQEAMEGLISVFHSYSANEGDKYKLSKAELKTLLQGELACLLAVSQ